MLRIFHYPALCMSILLSVSLNTLADAPVSADDAYRIKAGDSLLVSVWDEPELQREVLVLPDYTISFPLVGVLHVRDTSVAELIDQLESKLARFIPQANVHVGVQQVRGNQIYVLGKVNRPGQFDLLAPVTVLQALSMAGGLATFAAEDDITIIRQSGRATQQAIDFVYSELAEGRNLEQNIVLRHGDVVLVP